MARYKDRRHAGRVLASAVEKRVSGGPVAVLALPRGGVAVGYEVAQWLDAPLDVFVVRKLGVPGYGDLAMGAVASGGAVVINQDVVIGLGIPDSVLRQTMFEERAEVARREQLYRGDRPRLDVSGKTAILVDDGLATGASMFAAVDGLRQLNPARIVVAVPVASPKVCEELSAEVDIIVCAATPEPLVSVGHWYNDFEQLSDDDVRTLLEHARRDGMVGAGFVSHAGAP